MQQAQLQMLHGTTNAEPKANAGNRRSTLNAETGKGLLEFKPDPRAPYSHPYYWAPFILIGNWR